MYSINIREEVFGGTLFNLETGKREYINKIELENILSKNIFPNDIKVSENINSKDVKFTRLGQKDFKNHFSFADIIYLEVTRLCNLHCKHCLNNSGKTIPNQLSINELKEIVKQLANLGVQDIRFTGGEPLLNEGIFDLICIASNNGIYTSIGTNGTSITTDVASKLKKSGLKKAVVSIDGTENKHDSIRGEGNYKKTMSGLENLMQSNIDVRVNSVLMKSNIEEIIALAKEMNKKKIHLFIRRFLEAGRGEKMENNMLSKEDYQYVREQLKEELQDKYIIGHYLHDKRMNTRIDLPFKLEDCKAGQRALAIEADGNVKVCGFLSEQGVSSIGNIRDINDWRAFWNELQDSNQLCNLRCNLDKYNKIPGIQETYCLAYVQRLMNKGEL